MFRSSRTEPTPLDGRDSVLADLDGVVYKGADAIPFAVESLNRAAETLRVGYITNNASRTDASVAGHLSELGLSVRPEDVVTSPRRRSCCSPTWCRPARRSSSSGRRASPPRSSAPGSP